MDWHDFQLAANHFLQLESHNSCRCRHNKFHLSGASSAGRDATCPSSIPSFSQAIISIIPNITISQQWFCALLTWLWRSMIVVLWERRGVSFAGLAFCLPSISFRLFNWGGLPSISLLSLDGGFIMFHHSSIHSKVVLHNYIHIYIYTTCLGRHPNVSNDPRRSKDIKDSSTEILDGPLSLMTPKLQEPKHTQSHFNDLKIS